MNAYQEAMAELNELQGSDAMEKAIWQADAAIAKAEAVR